MTETALPDSSIAKRSGREHYPLRTTDLLAILLFWTFLALISAAVRELDPRFPDVQPRVMSAVVKTTYAEYALWAAITVPIWWLATRYSIEGGRRYGRVALLVLLGITIAILMDSLLYHFREEQLASLGGGGRFRRRPPPPFVGLGFLDDLMVYFAVLGSGIARDYLLRYRSRVGETVRLQAQLTQARLDALRAQLNPHFLFNTLNAVSALVERDPRGVRKMIARLSDLLRYTLDESTEQEVPLRRELDLLEEYIDLMQLRFQGQLNVVMDVGDDTSTALVPNLILQPVLENAFKHGVGKQTGAGEVIVRSRRVDGRLVLTVADNGPGPGEGEAGVGLTNTNARLRAMYGAEFKVTLRPLTPRGTEAEVVLPFHTQAAGASV